MIRLQGIETQCQGALLLHPAKSLLIDENLRGYTVLLSAHFQGFRRDLYTESSLLIASRVRLSLRTVIQS